MEIAKDRFYSILCALLVVACVLATVPVLEMGTNDDWSYTWIARNLAATGHFTFNGWIGAMVGIQAVWAALLIRLFGFSFTLVRLSTLPLAAGCAVLLYRLSRSAGLKPSFALFGTLSLTLSPIFIPVAASFMTDVPGFFFWLASIYCAVRAVQSREIRRACIWMLGAAITGVAGGTVRQVVWFVPMLVLPVVAWTRRKERASVVCAMLLWGASGLAMALCLRWFNAQQHTAYVMPHDPEATIDILQDIIESVVQIAVGCLLLILPVLALPLAAWRKWLKVPLPLVLGWLVPGALLAALWWFEDRLLLGNIITSMGMLGELDLPGDKPVILSVSLRFVIGAVLVVTAGVTAATLFRPGMGPRDEGLRRFAWFYGPAGLVYASALIYRSTIDSILFDRYLILLLPLLIVPLLWNIQRTRETPPRWGWVLIAVLAWFGIASTHDYLAAARARLQAATTATAAGVPRTQLSAGLEYDGWTQLEYGGPIPTPAEQAATPPRHYPVDPPYWFWAETPIIDPVYVVTYSPLPGLLEWQFPPIPFRTWLPPFRRQVLTQKAPKINRSGRGRFGAHQ